MRLPVIICALVALSNGAAADFRRDIPRAAWEPIFFRSINELSRKIHWRPLRIAPVSSHSLEVRVWIGFGVTPLEAFRLRRDGDHWSAQHVIDKPQSTAPLVTHSVAPKSGWYVFWRRLNELGFFTLPDSSALPPSSLIVTDGEAYVVEINDGRTYRTYQYSNPQLWRRPEAKKIVAIIDTIYRELAAGPKA